jgi:hypothetical protein
MLSSTATPCPHTISLAHPADGFSLSIYSSVLSLQGCSLSLRGLAGRFTVALDCSSIVLTWLTPDYSPLPIVQFWDDMIRFCRCFYLGMDYVQVDKNNSGVYI